MAEWRAIDKPTAIYALSSEVGHIRYVGKSISLESRIRGHKYARDKGEKTALYHWMRKIQSEGKELIVEVIDTVDPFDDWAARESFWIKKYRDEGHILLNLTTGGDGAPGHVVTEKTKKKLSDIWAKGKEYIFCEYCFTPFLTSVSRIKAGRRFCSNECSKKTKPPRNPNLTSAGLAARREKAKTRTHCRRGHLLADDNVQLVGSVRNCLKCRKITLVAYTAKKKAEREAANADA